MKLLFLALVSLPASAGDLPDPIPPILDATAIKAGVDPCEDFYQFACGGWLDRTVIPPDKSAVGRQTTAAADATDLDLHKILVAYSKGDFHLKSGAAPKIRDYYVSCMNIDKLSPAALANVKKRIAAIRVPKDRAAFARLIADLHLGGAGPLFGFGSAQDLDDSTQVIGDLYQGGLALGQRDYYLSTDDKGKEILEKYEAHIAKMMELVGDGAEDARKAAAAVMRIETALANASYTMADANNPSKTHHPLSVTDVAKLAPHFDWTAYFDRIGNHFTQHMNIDEPEFLRGLDRVLADTPKEDVDAYLTWHFVRSIASRVGGAVEKEDFAFWMAYLNGAKQPKPRWKICTQAIESQLGYGLAEAYVQTFDGKSIKAKTEEMIRQIKAAFSAELVAISKGPDAWMDADTAAKAAEKLKAVAQKVGGPEKWRDYASLRTNRNNYLDNVISAAQFESKRDIRKIGKPVDRTEWGMMPWEINAYYDRSKNEFNFPFGILQPPSLDLTASDGTNLGAFGGGTIGHELTHGFDNNGSQYDSKGNVKNWWSEQTLKQFETRAACYANQADQYKVNQVGLNVNGKNTLEENLADQGGVKLGYVVLDQELAKRPEAPLFAGKYNERQQYWLAYAQSWCTQITTESLRERMTTDVHPPAEFRVNAVVMNLPAFANDFACRTGARLAPANRCRIW